MKHISCILLAVLILMLPVLAAAMTVPANPMAQPGFGIISTAVPAQPTWSPVNVSTPMPTQAPTEAPTPMPTEEPTSVPTEVPTPVPTEVPTQLPVEATDSGNEENFAPAMPEMNYEADEDILSEEIVAQLDAEALEYLKADGEVIETIDGVRNILLVGVDARPGETRSRSDTMVILTVDGNRNEIRMTSLMRDMYVSIPGRGNNRINAAWVYGGPELLLQVIEENFGLKIEEYVAVDLRVLIDIVDELGGLTLTVETKQQLSAINGVIDAFNYQFKEKNNDGLLTQIGTQQMNGKQVQAYARYRRGESDVQRTARQREVLTLLFDKLQNKSIFELTGIAFSVMDRIETNLSFSEIVSLIPVAFGMKDAQFEQLTIPYDASYQNKTISGMAVIVPDISACRKEMDAFINKTDE